MSKYTESFEDWFDTEFETKPASYKLSRYTPTWKTWNHQQSKINELLERLKECEEALKFYASDTPWEAPMYPSYGRRLATIHDKDVSEFIAKTGHRWNVGGKRAREYFKKYEGKQ